LFDSLVSGYTAEEISINAKTFLAPLTAMGYFSHPTFSPEGSIYIEHQLNKTTTIPTAILHPFSVYLNRLSLSLISNLENASKRSRSHQKCSGSYAILLPGNQMPGYGVLLGIRRNGS